MAEGAPPNAAAFVAQQVVPAVASVQRSPSPFPLSSSQQSTASTSETTATKKKKRVFHRCVCMCMRCVCVRAIPHVCGSIESSST